MVNRLGLKPWIINRMRIGLRGGALVEGIHSVTESDQTSWNSAAWRLTKGQLDCAKRASGMLILKKWLNLQHREGMA